MESDAIKQEMHMIWAPIVVMLAFAGAVGYVGYKVFTGP